METVSKNTDSQPDEPNKDDEPKRKRGRPRTQQRNWLEETGIYTREFSGRNAMNRAYANLFWLMAEKHLTTEEQTALVGVPIDKMNTYPKGSITAASEMGRYMASCAYAEELQQVLHNAVDARRDGHPWSTIKRYYRSERVSAVRKGSTDQLLFQLLTVVEKYQQEHMFFKDNDALQSIQETFDAITHKEYLLQKARQKKAFEEAENTA